MSRLAIVPATSEFFVDEIATISKSHGLTLSPQVTQYLAEVLVKFASAQQLTLALPGEAKRDLTPTQFWLELQSLPLVKKYSALQYLGDYSLFTSGFFNERIRKSLLDMDYYQALGGQAYYHAGEIKESIAAERALNVFFSLADDFKKLCEIFSELYDRTLLTNSEGTLKLFERWQSSGSERLARLLMENGLQIDLTKKTSEQS